MKTKDVVTRNYLSECSRFAQVCNNELFGGNAVILPEKLKEIDTAVCYLPEGEDDLREFGDVTVQKQRDVAKIYDDEFMVLMIGIENQTGIHYAMPLRGQVYDTLNYEKQRLEIAKTGFYAGRVFRNRGMERTKGTS